MRTPKTIGPSAAQLVGSLEQIAKGIQLMLTAHPEVKVTIEATRLKAAQSVLAEVLEQIEKA